MSSGVPTWTSRPLRITPIRSLITIASSRLWVMYMKVLPVSLWMSLSSLSSDFPELVVDRRERLVEEQDLRVVGEGAGQGDALPLAARALGHVLAVIVLGQPDHAHQLQRPLAPDAGCDALHLERELDVLADRAVREQCQRLEDEAGRPPVRGQVVDPLCRAAGCRRRSGVSMPASMRSSVVLPEPDGPTTVKNSPSRTSRSTRSTAASSPNVRLDADELQDRPRRGNRGQGGQPRARFAAVIRSSALS